MKNASQDFTLVGTSKSGAIEAGLASVGNINELPAAKLKVLVSQVFACRLKFICYKLYLLIR